VKGRVRKKQRANLYRFHYWCIGCEYWGKAKKSGGGMIYVEFFDVGKGKWCWIGWNTRGAGAGMR